jgi:1,4-dihydroxy-2-naphthoyl-CoA hydrolase
MYVYPTHIGMRDTDAAGVVFFARYYALVHEAYEAWLRSHGIDVGAILREGRYALPVVHSECDYRRPLWCGEEIRIETTVREARRRTYAINFRIVCADGRVAAEGHTVHAAVNMQTGKSMVLPEDVRKALAEMGDRAGPNP